MKTKSGHNLRDVLKEALEVAEILEKERTEIEFDEEFVWTRRAPGEHRFDIDIPSGEWIGAGEIRYFDGEESKITKIIQVHAHDGYIRVLGLRQRLDSPPNNK